MSLVLGETSTVIFLGLLKVEFGKFTYWTSTKILSPKILNFYVIKKSPKYDIWT